MRLTSILYRKVGEWSSKYANLPERYIKRRMRLIYWKAPPNKPQYMKKVSEAKEKYIGIHRPWTVEYHMPLSGSMETPLIEPIKDWSFFRGDLVEVLVGKEKGKQGQVKEIFQERNWVTVEGLNPEMTSDESDLETKDKIHTVLVKEKPFLVTTDIALLDPSDLKPTKIKWRYTADGKKVRVSVRTGRIIPVPKSAQATVDYISPSLYYAQPKDTPIKEAEALTFEPCLKTFEMDIMDKMGIKEERVPKRTYWY